MKKEIKLNKTKENLKLIQIDNELYLIDVKAEIKEGDYILMEEYSLDSYQTKAVSHIKLPRIDKCKMIVGSNIWVNIDAKEYESESGANTTCFKVLASTKPLSGCLLIQSKEDEVERLANSYANNAKVASCDYECSTIEDAFKAGYKANKGMFNEAQVIKAIDMARIPSGSVNFCRNDEIIQSLKQPQVKITFEWDCDRNGIGCKNCDHTGKYIIKSVKQIV